MKHIIFDIETAPQDTDKLLANLSPFNPEEVKVGNIKDPELIKAKIASAKEKHEKDYIAKAALSAATGRVVAIGLKFEDGWEMVSSTDEANEHKLLEQFWALFTKHNDGHGVTDFIGHNIYDFDLPFLVRRSWVKGVKVPYGIYTHKGNRTFWNDHFVDTRSAWMLGQREGLSNLDLLGRLLHGAGKNGDGAQFYELMLTDPQKAKEYLHNDLVLTEAIAKKIGLM